MACGGSNGVQLSQCCPECIASAKIEALKKACKAADIAFLPPEVNTYHSKWKKGIIDRCSNSDNLYAARYLSLDLGILSCYDIFIGGYYAQTMDKILEYV